MKNVVSSQMMLSVILLIDDILCIRNTHMGKGIIQSILYHKQMKNINTVPVPLKKIRRKLLLSRFCISDTLYIILFISSSKYENTHTVPACDKKSSVKAKDKLLVIYLHIALGQEAPPIKGRRQKQW